MKKFKNNSGEVMLESAIVYSITLMLLMCILGIGFYIYQQTMLYAVANETAVHIAENYKYTNLNSIDDDYIQIPQMTNLKRYRSYLSLANYEKTREYVEKRAKLTSFDKNENAKIEELKIISDSIGRKRVTLRISMKSTILFDNALKYWGFTDDEGNKFYATAYAECMDLTTYVGQVKYVEYIADKTESSNVRNIISSLKKIINKIR